MTHPKDKADVALNVSAMLCEGQGRALGPGGAGLEGDKKLNLLGPQPRCSQQTTEEKQEFPIYGLICMKHQLNQTHNSTNSEMNTISSLLEIAFCFDHTNLFQASFTRVFLFLHQIFSLSFKALFELPAL